MTYRGRFAPSPTGLLHLGSLAAAVGSWLCARKAGGHWLLRMEDIDPPREAPGAAAAILAALPAFGLSADAPVLFQSTRQAAYDAAFEQLRQAGYLFPCWCSRHDLAISGGTHRDAQCIAPPDTSRPAAWRLRVPDRQIAFEDALQGPQQQNLREAVGDFVIRRVEGFYSYQLACVVDDAWQGISEVVRGYDLLDSTPRQIWLQQCLGLPTPRYLHLPLVLDAAGHKLSKSMQALPVDPEHPMAALRNVLRFLRVPTHYAGSDPHVLLEQALQAFQPATLPHCNSRFRA